MLGFGIVASCIGLGLAVVLWSATGRVSRQKYETGEILVADYPEPAPQSEFTIASYNIGYASGLANNTPQHLAREEYDANLESITEALRAVQADFVALQEVDYASRRSYHEDQLLRIADALALKYRARAYNWDRRYLPFPYWPLSAHYGSVLSGQAILSAYPVRAQSKLTLLKPANNPAWYNAYYPDRLLHFAEIDINGTTLTLLNVHLEAYQQSAREAQANIVADAARAHMDGPLIVLGDFNALPPWTTVHLSDTLDTEKGDRPLDSVLPAMLSVDGLHSAIPEDCYESGADPRFFTFRSDHPRVAIDHIFHNDFVECLSAEVLRSAGTGSDHLPIVMRFRLHSDS